MHQFKDSGDRTWSLSLNLGEAKRLKDALAVDLLDPASLQKLCDDPYTVANVLYALCEGQAKAAGITDEQFGALLAGDTIDAATDALLAEIVDFFPRRQREALKSLLAKIQAARAEGVSLAEEKLTSPQMEQAIQRARQTASLKIDELLASVGEPSGNVPGSPA
jgi:hypothetical protein